MKRKRTHQAADVQQVHARELLAALMAGCIVAVDVAKMKMMVALATITGEVVKLFRFEHPTETRECLRVVREIREGLPSTVKVVAAMEPTGSYGDALRHQLVGLGVPVFMVSPKRTYDSKELFDGVPSLHDAKSAVLIARLHVMGLSTKWTPPPPMRTRLRALVDMRQHALHREEECHGWMEGVLARSWPELQQWANVREQKSALHLLEKYPSPALVRADPEGAKALLREASRGRLSVQAMEGLIAGAQMSLGVPTAPEEEQLLRTVALQVLEASKQKEDLERQMREVGAGDVTYVRLSRWMGTVTAAVMVTMCDPLQYACAFHLEKGIGLNLREKSSGQMIGRLSITKRGPGLVRQMMYLFALRTIQSDAVVRAWYERRQGYSNDSRMRAVIAVMRKLARAMFHVARGSVFDASKLFDVRCLGLEAPKVAATTDGLAEATATTKVAATEQDTMTAPTKVETSTSTPTRSASPTSPPTTPSDVASKSTSAVTTPQPTDRSATSATPPPHAPREVNTGAPTKSRGARSVNAARANGASSSAAPEDEQQAAEPAVQVSSSRHTAVPNEPMSAAAPMTLAALQAAANAAAAACTSGAPSRASSSSRAVVPRTTPRPIARERRRTQQTASASK